MKRRSLLILLIIIGFMGMAQSCEKENENETTVSAFNGDDSHNMGQNCMNCHKQGGSGEGWFNLAGTVFNESLVTTYPNATVKLYSGSNGTGNLDYTIEVDAKGNFFTTKEINFGTGLYVSVQGSTTSKYMVSSVNSGQCNSCHGITTAKIWTK